MEDYKYYSLGLQIESNTLDGQPCADDNECRAESGCDSTDGANECRPKGKMQSYKYKNVADKLIIIIVDFQPARTALQTLNASERLHARVQCASSLVSIPKKILYLEPMIINVFVSDGEPCTSEEECLGMCDTTCQPKGN